MDYRVNSGVWGAMFGVPCIVPDNFLKLATGAQIKVLLYPLRASGRSVSSAELSAGTGVPQAEAEEAVLFWQQANILSAENSSVPQPVIVPAAPVAPADSMQSDPEKDPEPQKPAVQQTEQSKPAAERRALLSPSDIAEIMKDTPDISELFKISESILGSLNYTMQNSLITMKMLLGLPAEVLITLITYCKVIDKAQPAYIEKVASAWAESGIDTLELAQEDVERMSRSRTYTGKVMKAFEMRRNPTSNQAAFIEDWQNLGISEELLRYAYELTIEKIDKLSFPYINSILRSWSDSGFRTKDDVKAAEPASKRKKSSSGDDSEGSLDLNEYKQFINNF